MEKKKIIIVVVVFVITLVIIIRTLVPHNKSKSELTGTQVQNIVMQKVNNNHI